MAADSNASPNLPEYSVSEISAALKRTVEDSFGYVRVRGEISGFTRARSGHLYMSLKDDRAVMDAVCWRGTAGKLKIAPEDGLEVICTGRLTTYPARSRYQLVIESMEPAGLGALMQLLEERRRKFAAAGLFDEARKQALPYLPETIGVVTSPTGAVIRDILHRLHDRFPRHVLVWPVPVQGEGAEQQIAAAIRGFDALPETGGPVPRPDLLIVARGGGSIEDLWCFNDEAVVLAAADCRIPLISAVGHETDTTLIDFVADRRAPTPTAAAEMAVPVRAELQAATGDLAGRLVRAAGRLLERRRADLGGLRRGLRRPADLLKLAEQRHDEAAGRLARALTGLLQRRRDAFARRAGALRPPRERLRHAGERLGEAEGRRRRALGGLLRLRRQELQRVAAGLRPRMLSGELIQARERQARAGHGLDSHYRRLLRDAGRRLDGLGKLLDSLSYRGVLSRGYAVIRDAAGLPLTRAASVAAGADLSLEFADGRIAARAAGDGDPAAGPASEGTAARKPAPRRRPEKPKGGAGGQGSLFE